MRIILELWRSLRGTPAALAEITHRLSAMEKHIMSSLDDLAAQVAATASIEASAIALIRGLSDKLDHAVAEGNLARVAVISSELKASSDALAAAISATPNPAPVEDQSSPAPAPVAPVVEEPAPAPAPAPAAEEPAPAPAPAEAPAPADPNAA